MEVLTIVLAGKLTTKRFPLGEGQSVVIGRGENVDIQIFESELSRRHCAIGIQGGKARITDLRSSNGTRVNGELISEAILKDGDRISLGDNEFSFSIEQPRKASHVSTGKLSAAFANRASGEWTGQIYALYGAVRALVAAIEAKDEYTRGHSERVTAYAMHIGEAMKLSESKLNTLELGGFLHDMGKIGVPETILHKPTRLTDEEYQVIKRHPQVGYDILRQMEGTESIGEVVLHHHERWDGGGYPNGLRGEAIPLLARILAVADTFDAMGSRRPYRDRIPQAKVLAEIEGNAGSQFDPGIVTMLMQEARAGRILVEADYAQLATFQYQAVRTAAAGA